MPRSNKKKKIFHPVVPDSDSAIAHLLNIEKFTMIARAIVSIFSVSLPISRPNQMANNWISSGGHLPNFHWTDSSMPTQEQ